jgi:hypothetical protein
MAKKQTPAVATGTEVIEEFHVTAEEEGVEFVDVTGKDDLPEGVADSAEDEEESAKPVKPAKAAKPTATEDEIPEDLKGKTPAQLAKMYKEAQTLIGRQGTELGDLRRAADKYISAHLTRTATPAAPAAPAAVVKVPDDVDFFTNPQASIAHAIANHPALKNLEGVAKEYAKRELMRSRKESEMLFQASHPDAAEVMGDEAFREWIVKSPVRQQMLLRAHKQYDLDAANELFNTWKELKAARAPATPAAPAKPAGKPAAPASAARVPTGGNASPKQDKTGEKIYRRADVIRLMEKDPERYQLMADEITKAYSEGRVR